MPDGLERQLFEDFVRIRDSSVNDRSLDSGYFAECTLSFWQAVDALPANAAWDFDTFAKLMRGAVPNPPATLSVWMQLRKKDVQHIRGPLFKRMASELGAGCCSIFGGVRARIEFETDIPNLESLVLAVEDWIELFGTHCSRAGEIRSYAQYQKKQLNELKAEQRQKEAVKATQERARLEERELLEEEKRRQKAREARALQRAAKQREQQETDAFIKLLEYELAGARWGEIVEVVHAEKRVRFRAPAEGWLAVRLFHSAHQLKAADQDALAQKLGERLLEHLEGYDA